MSLQARSKPLRWTMLAGLLVSLSAPHATSQAELLDGIGEGLRKLGNAVGDVVSKGVKDGTAMADGRSQIVARYNVNGQTVSCFEGVKTGYILPYGATNPGAPGTRVTPFDCDKLAERRAQGARDGMQQGAGVGDPGGGVIVLPGNGRAASGGARIVGDDDPCAAEINQIGRKSGATDRAMLCDVYRPGGVQDQIEAADAARRARKASVAQPGAASDQTGVSR